MKIATFVVLSFALAGPVSAATIPVVAGAVVIADEGTCSLREAIVNANAGAQTHDDCVGGDAGADTITLANNSTYSLPDADNGQNGLPVITSAITIVGNGSTVTRSGKALFRLFDVAAAGNLTLLQTNITNGFTDDPDNGAESGGGVRNTGTFTLTNGAIAGNRTGNSIGGAGLYNRGTATLTNCTLSGNTCPGCYGGVAIMNDTNATLSMTNCTVSENGSLDPSVQVLINGGTILNFGAATMTNCTVTKNIAGGSNGAFGAASGIISGAFGNANSLSLVRTIVAGNFFIPGFSGFFGTEIGDHAINALPNITADQSIFGHAGVNDAEAFGEQTQSDPKWLPDADNIKATSDGANIPLDDIIEGTLQLNAPGNTATHALPIGSVAIDFGTNCPPPATDQRGVGRPIDGDGDETAACDAGAFEFNCGNGLVEEDAGEECDEGEGNGGNFCQNDCTLRCGDGEVDEGEQCDDGNQIPTDACNACQNARCGDEVVWEGQEECDDGNTESGDGCSEACTSEGGGVPPQPTPVPRCKDETPSRGCTVNGVSGPTVPCRGTNAADVIVGTSGTDMIKGLKGNDVVKGKSGNDVVCGGKDDDTVKGGGGADVVFGNAGNDVVNGGKGNDVVKGGKDVDTAIGGDGVDACTGESSVDCEL